MRDLSQFHIISSLDPLEYCERFNPDYEMALARKKYDNSGEHEQMYLYQIFLKRKFKKEDGETQKMSPVVSTHFCFAPSEEEAIMQVKGMAFPEYPYLTDQEMEDMGGVEATAIRIPFHIRGWGRRIF